MAQGPGSPGKADRGGDRVSREEQRVGEEEEGEGLGRRDSEIKGATAARPGAQRQERGREAEI